MRKIDTIIFDLGGVLIDWNPRYLYRKLFDSEEEMEWFLQNICTSEWNERQDGGRPFDEATEELVAMHPEWESRIRAWYGRWKETIGGQVDGTVNLLRKLKDETDLHLYAITNWSAETFPWARENFEFLGWFKGIVVSGEEKICKPHPRIYQALIERHNVVPGTSVFIDDNLKNVEGAKNVGIRGIHFQSPKQLESELKVLGIL